MLIALKNSAMKHWILSIILIQWLSDTSSGEEGSSVTTESLVVKHGYPFEKHEVETSDGYLLTLHRIPYSARVDTPDPRPVAFLMHGLVCSSSDWILLGPDNALAFILSDAGYDVWMGNARGTRYSRKHVTLSPFSRTFWNFDWHEIGMFDLPAMIDYVRYVTGEDQVRYFAHSQGGTAFLVLNSLNPEFKNRIKSAHLLAPAVFMNHMTSPIAKIVGPLLLVQPNAFVELLGSMEYLPNTKLQELFGHTTCKDTAPTQILCTNALFLIAGVDEENLNTTLLPEIIATSPAGASINQFYHYLQEYNSGYFRQFDYGWPRNLLMYGNVEPPNYPLENVDVPIFLYYGKNDYFVAETDIYRLMRHLSDSTLRRAYRVEHPKWNHFDFVWGLNIRPQLYNTIMEDVASIN